MARTKQTARRSGSGRPPMSITLPPLAGRGTRIATVGVNVSRLCRGALRYACEQRLWQRIKRTFLAGLYHFTAPPPPPPPAPVTIAAAASAVAAAAAAAVEPLARSRTGRNRRKLSATNEIDAPAATAAAATATAAAAVSTRRRSKRLKAAAAPGAAATATTAAADTKSADPDGIDLLSEYDAAAEADSAMRDTMAYPAFHTRLPLKPEPNAAAASDAGAEPEAEAADPEPAPGSSALFTAFRSNPLYDRNCLSLIFELLEPFPVKIRLVPNDDKQPPTATVTAAAAASTAPIATTAVTVTSAGAGAASAKHPNGDTKTESNAAAVVDPDAIVPPLIRVDPSGTVKFFERAAVYHHYMTAYRYKWGPHAPDDEYYQLPYHTSARVWAERDEPIVRETASALASGVPITARDPDAASQAVALTVCRTRLPELCFDPHMYGMRCTYTCPHYDRLALSWWTTACGTRCIDPTVDAQRPESHDTAPGDTDCRAHFVTETEYLEYCLRIGFPELNARVLLQGVGTVFDSYPTSDTTSVQLGYILNAASNPAFASRDKQAVAAAVSASILDRRTPASVSGCRRTSRNRALTERRVLNEALELLTSCAGSTAKNKYESGKTVPLPVVCEPDGIEHHIPSSHRPRRGAAPDGPIPVNALRYVSVDDGGNRYVIAEEASGERVKRVPPPPAFLTIRASESQLFGAPKADSLIDAPLKLRRT